MNSSRRMTRRDFLRLSALTAAGAVLSGCAPAYNWLAEQAEEAVRFGLPPGETPFDFQLLNRLTFGPRAEERWRMADIGWQAWVEEQLSPEGIDDPVCDLRLRGFNTLSMGANDLYDLSDKLFDDQDRLRVPDELRRSALIRQVVSRRQLFERMVEFWSDHFNISVEKSNCFYLKTVDDREVIRKHALGNFGEMLSASAHSPAMLTYLDNQANHKDAPNENYARELLELHSLGVDGGYSQQDVMELARCLTGWTIKEHFWRGDFVFKKENHDDGSKFVLGWLIQPDGQSEVEGILEELAVHPSSCPFHCAQTGAPLHRRQPSARGGGECCENIPKQQGRCQDRPAGIAAGPCRCDAAQVQAAGRFRRLGAEDAGSAQRWRTSNYIPSSGGWGSVTSVGPPRTATLTEPTPGRETCFRAGNSRWL